LFRTNLKFFIRPDLAVANPARWFMDAGYDFQFTADSLILTNLVRNGSNGGSANVPEGNFSYHCEGDSMILLGGSSQIPPDTIMRMAFRIP
ncbi:MAG TPA: hypothetical protein VLB27_09440, partial [candidate division Zixibacteria bacterium]|nr:hypothetical protein [candidate division Zixibacteria bacterium]